MSPKIRHNGPVFGQEWRPTHRAFYFGFLVGLAAMAGMVFAHQLWGNEGGLIASIVFVLGIAATTSYFRTRPTKPQD